MESRNRKIMSLGGHHGLYNEGQSLRKKGEREEEEGGEEEEEEAARLSEHSTGPGVLISPSLWLYIGHTQQRAGSRRS